MTSAESILWHIRFDLHTTLAIGSDVALDLETSNNCPNGGSRVLFVLAGRYQYHDLLGNHVALDSGDSLIARADVGSRLTPCRPDSRPAGNSSSDGMPGLIGGHGILSLAGHSSHPLITGLPDRVRLPGSHTRPTEAQRHPGMLLARLFEDRQTGDEVIVARLLEVLAIKVITGCYGTTASQHPFLRALSDAAVGAAIAAIHARPAYNWNLERLADIAGVSRSAFCLRFNSLAGMPPMRYLTEWRMHLALSRLRDGAGDLDAVARDTGYRSSTAFHKAFKRIHGVTPSAAATACYQP